MHYELYIDVFFLVNFMMDYILLAIVRKISPCLATHGSICVGAMLGAVLTCVVVIVPGLNMPVKFLLFHGVINVVMIKTGLKLRWDKVFARAYILLYICAFLMGGIMQYFHQYIRVGSLFFALALAGYYVSLGIWNFFTYLAARRAGHCTVVLVKDEKECRAEALIDTGNRLRDSVTGKPVSIVSEDMAKKLGFFVPETGSVEEMESADGIRYIPYHSVGRAQGVMPVIMPDRMCIENGRPIWIEHPVVAVCEEYMTMDDYEMLINPDLL